MLKLKLENITKTYGETVTALKKVSLDFRKSEFVSILGPSGCGKTTMLNIIGGLDHYDSGNLIINGLSTQEFTDSDWDAYRNRSIGFVFQSYNLIGHQTVLQNVEIALTLSGVSPTERSSRAKNALADVGLSDQIHKKPNQLSGGQMQRVAIARALVNDPDIILADEPTGALDSVTSVQLMEILTEIAKKRLVIMVTHNGDLAERYSSRIVRMLDGEIQSDSNPVTNDEFEKMDTAHVMEYITQLVNSQKKKLKKTSMSLKTATRLSFKNLLTKKGRTVTTAIAGSIGIISVALVLALSSGLSTYMSDMQSNNLSGYPITIGTQEQTVESSSTTTATTRTEYPTENVLLSYNRNASRTVHTNVLTTAYLDYIANIQTAVPDAVNSISYTRGLAMNVLTRYADSTIKFDTAAVVSADTDGDGGGDRRDAMFGGGSSTYWTEMPVNTDVILSMYDLIGDGSRLPASKNEVILVVDKYNQIDKEFLNKLGLTGTNYKLTDFIGKTIFSVVQNNEYYTKPDALFTEAQPSAYTALYDNENSVQLTIVGILRVKPDVTTSYLSSGIAYTKALTDYLVANAQVSDIAVAQKASSTDVILGTSFINEVAKKARLLSVGADTTPTGISIYPKDYETKGKIRTYLDSYNTGKAESVKVLYSDMAESIASMTSTLLSSVTLVLTGFAAIALLVSTIMIGIITYVSVIERTKEIGILRAVGARKKDISRVFIAEALIVGFTSGLLGIVTTYILMLPINVVIENLTGLAGLANLSILSALALILGSMVLTIVAAFFPSKTAAKKDPVEALRTE